MFGSLARHLLDPLRHSVSDANVAFDKGAGMSRIVLTAPRAFVDIRLADTLVILS